MHLEIPAVYLVSTGFGDTQVLLNHPDGLFREPEGGQTLALPVSTTVVLLCVPHVFNHSF